MMIIDVRKCLELKGHSLALEHTYELPQLLARNKQLLQIKPVHFVGQGDMQAGILAVKGELTGTYTLACSRCLTDVESEFTQEIEERFNIHAKFVGEPEDDEETEIHEVVGQEIDLLPYIEEAIVVSIPFVPLCPDDEECKRSMPQEGKSWAVLTEEGNKDRIDPRLADLANFFDKNNNDK